MHTAIYTHIDAVVKSYFNMCLIKKRLDEENEVRPPEESGNSVLKFSQTQTMSSHICANEQNITHTHIQYLKREPSRSLRHSVRNKYLIGGWPTSCALKSYLSYSASIHRRGLLRRALQRRVKERERHLCKKKEERERERGGCAERQKSRRAEWEVIWTENKCLIQR